MSKDYTSQIFGSNPGWDPAQFDTITDPVHRMEVGKNSKGKKGHKKAIKKLRKAVKAMRADQQATQQILTALLWQVQSQAAFITDPPKKKGGKKKSKKKGKKKLASDAVRYVVPKAFDFATAYMNRLPSPQGQYPLGLPDRRK